MNILRRMVNWIYHRFMALISPIRPAKANEGLLKAIPNNRMEWEVKAAAKGVRGDDLVIAVQSSLVVIGFPLGNFGRNQNGVDGDMGPMTRAALKMFQTLFSLTPTGEPDSPTMAKLKTIIQAGQSYRNLVREADSSRILLSPINNFQDAEFVNIIYFYALREESQFKVPAAVTTAQAILETFYGKRVAVDLKTGRYSYNLFGLKGKGPAGSVRSRTREENPVTGVWEWTVTQFQAYYSYEDSIRGHVESLSGNPRYAKAFQARIPAGFARVIARAGFATDSRYAQKIIFWMKYWGLK
jgi:hypothetical protein